MSRATTSMFSRRIVEGTVLQVGYVGSKGTKLFRVRDINQAMAGVTGTIQQRRPFNAVYPDFAGIYQLEASANSRYNALQAVLRRRLSNNLTLFASHVWSHSIDDASNGICSCTAGVSLPQNSFDTRAEKAASSFDQRQRFTVNFVYDLAVLPRLLEQWPKRLTAGLAVERHLQLGSGLPITPFWNGAAPSGSGESSNDRPNVDRQSQQRTEALGRLVQHRGFRAGARPGLSATPGGTRSSARATISRISPL